MNEGQGEAADIADIARRTLRLFALSCYAVTLVHTCLYWRDATVTDALAGAFLAAVQLTYAAVYSAPTVLATLALGALARRPALRRLASPLVVFAPGVVLGAATQVLLHTDQFIFHRVGFHLNGFVANIILTPGGVESLGHDGSTTVYVLELVAGFFALHVALAVAAVRWGRRDGWHARLVGRRALVLLLAILTAAGLGERAIYAVAHARGYAPILAASSALPFYVPATWRRLIRAMGLEAREQGGVRIRVGGGGPAYPLAPLRSRPGSPRPNIVWLCSESFRADALVPEVMPATHAFARERATLFQSHYSGGNGTRMGIFSQFYGVHGAYWFSFLDARRSPALIDFLQAQSYDLQCFTSARFTYPEFDRTVWAGVPRERLHEIAAGQTWERDRENVAQLLSSIDARPRDRPFFRFAFFEALHSLYTFAPDSVIKRPYLEDPSYAGFDINRDLELMRARYVNSAHHLDSQIKRVLAHLEEQKLLDSTIVIVTGDHGEEFMEWGRWGHNSAFSDPQMRVPLMVYVPGRAPEVVTRLTSHVDLPVTLLRHMGVENDPADYTVGRDLFTGEPRRYTIVSDWDTIVYVDDRTIAEFPLASGKLLASIHDKSGHAVADSRGVIDAIRTDLVTLMSELKRYSHQIR